jgi:DNA-binding CsgD family transcriptional regulator
MEESHAGMQSGMGARAVLPSRVALDEARSAWSRGDFKGCLARLDEIGVLSPRSGSWVEATLLRARSLYRLRRYPETIALLEPVLSGFADGDETSTAHMLLGSSIARSGDVARGLAILDATAARADERRVHRAVQAEIAHARALAHWARREFDQTERLARTAEAAGADIISVRATQLRAFVALAELRFGEALALFNLTYDAYWRCRERDADLAEMIVHQIAVLEIVLRSRSVPGTHALAERRRVRDPWDTTTDVPTVTRLQTNVLDAWLFALDGDRDTAFRKARQAEEMATETAWRVWALAGRAALAGAFGEAGSAREHAAFAVELAQRVRWADTTGEERVGLLLLAEVLAVTDSASATAILATYDALPGPMDPDHAFSSDPRLGALEDYVRGAVQRVTGNTVAAHELLAKAARTYESCGHLWRTALARLELHAVASRGGHLDAARAIVAKHFPTSFLARRVGTDTVSDPIVARLTPAQRDVLALLLDGLSAREIATKTGRAYNTVRVHIDRLREAFEAPSIHALVVDCHRRGIVLRLGRPHHAKDEPIHSCG